MIWSLTKTFYNLDEMTHLYNMAFEMFVLFGVVRPISSLSHQGKSFCQDSSFLEFIIQMLLSRQNIRYWTSTFLQVAYTRKYGHDVADPQVTLTLANHLNSNLQLRCHEIAPSRVPWTTRSSPSRSFISQHPNTKSRFFWCQMES